MLMSISSTMDILNRTQKISRHTTKSVCQTAFQEPFLIGKEFSMNLALCKLIFQKYIYSCRVLLIEWRILIDTWVESIFYLSIFLKILLKLLKMLKVVVDLSNENLVKNIDGLLAERTAYQDIERMCKKKKRLPDNHNKMSYWFFSVC